MRAAGVRLRQDQGVNPMLITIVLTVLAAVVVVLTRVRLANDDGGAGRISIPQGLLNTHTYAGVPALLLWAGYLLTALVFARLSGVAGRGFRAPGPPLEAQRQA